MPKHIYTAESAHDVYKAMFLGACAVCLLAVVLFSAGFVVGVNYITHGCMPDTLRETMLRTEVCIGGQWLEVRK